MNRLLLQKLMNNNGQPSQQQTTTVLKNTNQPQVSSSTPLPPPSSLLITTNSSEKSNNSLLIKHDSTTQLRTSLEDSSEEENRSLKRSLPPSLEELEKKNNNENEDKPIFISKKERKIDISTRIKQTDEQKEEPKSSQFSNLQSINIIDPLQLMDKNEIEEIKSSYIEKKPNKRKIQKTNEKTKISFEWDEKDDTTDKNAIVSTIASPPPLRKVNNTMKNNAQQQQHNSKKHRKDKLVEDERNWTEKAVHEMTDRDWRIFREDFDIVVKGGKVPPPLRNWDETTILPLEIINAITDLKFKEPTPVQKQCIPIAMNGIDLVGLAETGSGKTASYIIPMCCQIAKLPRMNDEIAKDGPYGLILVPTRELAEQIEREAIKFARQFEFRVQAIIGGVSIEKQSRLIRGGCEILVATPGRLIDCLNNSIVVLNQCHFLVLDEADKMIEMNFEKDVNTILENMPTHIQRQTMLFSATMPPEVESIAMKYLLKRVTVAVGEVGKAVERIEQQVVWIKHENAKRDKLLELLSEADPPIIVFCNLKKEVDLVAKFVSNAGFRSTSIHGNKSQEARNAALEAFKSGKFDVMVATDVLGRGIDIRGVTLVVNYSLPKTISAYTHRIGRTGRAGRTGKAVSLLTKEDTEIMYDLKKMLETTKNTVPEELSQHPSASQKPEKKKPSDQQQQQQESDETL